MTPSFSITVVREYPILFNLTGDFDKSFGVNRLDLGFVWTLTSSLLLLLNCQYSPLGSFGVCISVVGSPPGMLSFLIPPALWRYAQRPEEGRRTARRETFALTTSLSVLLMATAVCFLLKAVRGKYVFGPTSTNKHPLVDRLSYSPACSASAKSHSLQSVTLSPMKALCLCSRVELM